MRKSPFSRALLPNACVLARARLFMLFLNFPALCFMRARSAERRDSSRLVVKRVHSSAKNAIAHVGASFSSVAAAASTRGYYETFFSGLTEGRAHAVRFAEKQRGGGARGNFAGVSKAAYGLFAFSRFDCRNFSSSCLPLWDEPDADLLAMFSGSCANRVRPRV